MLLNRPRARLDLGPIRTIGAPSPAVSFASLFAGYSASINAWWEYRLDLIEDDQIGPDLLAKRWHCRIPGSGASWQQDTEVRKPRHDPGLGLFFKGDAVDVMELVGAAVPSGDKTILIVHMTDPSETGTSYPLANLGTTDTIFGFKNNVVAGGTMYAQAGPEVASAPYTFGEPIWHTLTHKKAEKVVILETMGGGVVTSAVGAAERTTETVAFMGGSNAGGSGNYIGTMFAGMIWNEALYSTVSGTHASQAAKRDAVRRYADTVVNAIR